MKLDINIWLGFLGVFSTIIFGFLSIYWVKSKRYPGRLTFITEHTIGLFDSIIKNFPQIAITYNNKAIDQQLVLLKGFILNTGSIDIKDDMVEENLKLILPEKFKWLSAKIVDSTKGSKPTTTIASENELIFSLGLFRKTEFLRFEALADIPQSSDNQVSATQLLTKELKFYHRIADTNKVEIRPINLELPNLKNDLFGRILLPAMLFIGLIFMLLAFSNEEKLGEFHFHQKVGGSILELRAKPHIDNNVDLIDVSGKKIKTIPIEEFNTNFEKVEIKKPIFNSWFSKIIDDYFFIIFLTILGVMFMITILTFIINPIREYREIKKIRQTLNLDIR